MPSWIKVHQWAAEALEASAGRALSAIFLPTNRTKIDRGVARAVANALLPKDRMVRLPVPDIDGPESQSIATHIVYEAAREGVITPAEALQWLDLIDRRYESWMRYRTAPPIRQRESRSGRAA